MKGESTQISKGGLLRMKTQYIETIQMTQEETLILIQRDTKNINGIRKETGGEYTSHRVQGSDGTTIHRTRTRNIAKCIFCMSVLTVLR